MDGIDDHTDPGIAIEAQKKANNTGNEPPKPLCSPDRLAVFGRLTWAASPGAIDASGAAVGLLADTSSAALTALYLVSGEAWAAGPCPATPPALGPFLCSNDTARVLQQGTLEANGLIAYAGRRYQLQALTEGARNIARAVPA